MIEITRTGALRSPAASRPSTRPALRVGLVQHRWQPDPEAVKAELRDGIARAADQGAAVVFLSELTLSRYPADTSPDGRPADVAEDLMSGPTFAFAAEAARRHEVCVHASLYERADGPDGRGLNTSILVSPQGQLLARTHKLHIPVSSGYCEDQYFRPGPAGPDAYRVYAPAELDGAKLGMPACWDQWFPELARIYSLGGAELLAYPSAIGSEPEFPELDTQPMWQKVITGNAVANGLFMVVPNRWGDEGNLTFFGSSFICDPYGRVLVEAPRNESAVLVADLDLDQRGHWLSLFPFLENRRPETYGVLTAEAPGPAPAPSAAPAAGMSVDAGIRG
ncbi:nitrilase-related carbon-nitrogen hydrolase [Arthrobacter sp. 7Tela_A1]|uniref:nitrilase-related carbon-nitrogen hydrolase n=1 Tax=Arthrobacter sp. 7Tela_A1 TaxID=3093745 RepID=UPI003BB7957C